MLKNRALSLQQDINQKTVAETVRRYYAHIAGQDELHLPPVKTNDLDEFYKNFEPFLDSYTNEPVTTLAKLQHEIWQDRFKYIYRCYPKSQKITVSSICLLEDIHHALTDCMGYEIFVVAQTVDHAKLHMQDIRKMILASEYHDYLITKPIPGLLLRDEVTKVETIYLQNLVRPWLPTRIFAKGFEAGQLISHKRVKHIHASDIAKSKLTVELKREAFGAMMTRLGPSQGSCVMESIPGGLNGILYEQYEKYVEIVKSGIDLEKQTRKDQMKYPFYCKKYTVQHGLDEGVITPEFVEGEKLRLGPMFAPLYMADFFQSEEAWYFEEDFKISDDATEFFSGVGL